MRFWLRFQTLLALLTVLLAAASGAPVFVGLPTGSSSDHVAPHIPIGKALIIPLSVYDDSGVQPTITVKTSDPQHFFARVKTGNPLLKMHVKYSGSPSAYEGDLVFQLFNDRTPQTARFIGGFAQSGFYDGLIFHRLADLVGGVPGSGTPNIFQGGDPDIDSTSTTANHGPGFAFDNEPVAELMLAGRGQLAMANAGTDSNYHGTNGSQFFITDTAVRSLDFHYTIFGQLTHGWELLNGLRATPRNSSDRPTSPVTITSASVATQFTGTDVNGGTHTYTDAVLVLSAIRAGTTTVTVTAGGTSATFTATAVKDTVNSPPFFVPTDDVMTAQENTWVPYHAVDLEYDRLDIQGQFLNNTVLSGTSTVLKGGYVTSPALGTFPLYSNESPHLTPDLNFGFVLRRGEVLYPGSCFQRQVVFAGGNPKYPTGSGSATAPYSGPLQPLLVMAQWHPDYRPGYDPQPIVTDATFPAALTVGVAPLSVEPATVTGAPGVALAGLVAGRFIDPDRQARPENYTAAINWGDGKNVSTAGTIAFSAAPGGYHEFTVTGGTTYAKAGVYPVVVTITGLSGWTRKIQSNAVITANTLVATAPPLTLRGPAVRQQQMAVFTDSHQPGAASAYSATIDWGDGTLSAGTIVASTAGTYRVLGTHSYADPETFSTVIRVHKSGATADQDAIVWNRLILTGFTGQQHLPPFNQAHLSGLFFAAAVDPFNSSLGALPIKQTAGQLGRSSQTYLNLELEITNSGNLASKPTPLTIYLTRGTSIQRTAVKDGQGNVITPADIPLPFGPLLPTAQSSTPVPQTSLMVPSIPPGCAVVLTFKQNAFGDYRLRLPANDTGTGLNLIADLQTNDPLLANEPVTLPVYGRIEGVTVNRQELITSESGTKASFYISADRKPSQDVTIPLSGDSTRGKISPASVTFTASNWTVPQLITVSGASNTPSATAAPATYQLKLGPATSADARYNGLVGPTLNVLDDEANIAVAATPGQTAAATVFPETAPTVATTAAAGASHVGTVTLTMTKAPTAAVTVQITIGNTANGQLLPGESNIVTFSPSEFVSNGQVSKTFHIQGLNDKANAGNTLSYSVTFAVTSTDTAFGGISPAAVAVTNKNEPPVQQ